MKKTRRFKLFRKV